ncbi:MAG: hypothetical protein ACHQ5A_00835 [Opitutales bacterium]
MGVPPKDSSAVLPVIVIPPAFLTHLVKAVLCAVPAVSMGWLVYQLAFVDAPLSDPLAQYGLEAGFAAVAIMLALVAIRNVRALFVRPELVLTPEGFRLTSWRGTGFLGIFLPHYRMKQHVVPWDDFASSLFYSHSVNGITMEEELRLTTRTQGLLAFGWDVFHPSVKKIQRTLLDYVDERLRAPLRTAGRLAEFQHRRWAEPLVLPGGNLSVWLVVGCWALAAALGLAAWYQEFSHDWVAICALAGVIVSFAVTKHWRNAARCRHVALGADGLAVGAEAVRCPLIPWESIRFVRAHTRHNVRNDKDANIERVEVRLADGKAVMIEGREQADLRRLAAYLEPPLDQLPEVWNQMAQGLAPEAAACAAGLLPRS